MARRSRVARKKSSARANLSRKRRADTVPLLEDRATRSDKRSRVEHADEEEIGDFIVVDTGTADAIDHIEKQGNESPQLVLPGDISDGSLLQKEEGALESTNEKSDLDVNAVDTGATEVLHHIEEDDNESPQQVLQHDASEGISLQANEVALQITNETSDIDVDDTVDAAQQPHDDVLALDPEPTDLLGGTENLEWSAGLSEDFIFSGPAPGLVQKVPFSPSSDGEQETAWPTLCSEQASPAAAESTTPIVDEKSTGSFSLPIDPPDINICSPQPIALLPKLQVSEPSSPGISTPTIPTPPPPQNNSNSKPSPPIELPGGRQTHEPPESVTVPSEGQRVKIGMFGIITRVPTDQTAPKDNLPYSQNGVLESNESDNPPSPPDAIPVQWNMQNYDRVDNRQETPSRQVPLVPVVHSKKLLTPLPSIAQPLPSPQQPFKAILSDTSEIHKSQGSFLASSRHLPHISPTITESPGMENFRFPKSGVVRQLRPQPQSSASQPDLKLLQTTSPRSPTTSNSIGNGAPHTPPAPQWNAVNRTPGASPEAKSSISTFVNARVMTSSPNTRHGLPSSRSPRPLRPDSDTATTHQSPRKTLAPFHIRSAGSIALPSNQYQLGQNLPSTIYQSNIPSRSSLTISEPSKPLTDNQRLRDWAAKLIAGRNDVELEDDETTGGPKRAYPDIRGAVVDKTRAHGIVVITARGFPVQQVDTGPGATGPPYAELILHEGQVCITYGNSTVLFYKPRKPPLPKQGPTQSQARVSSIHQMINPSPPTLLPRTPLPSTPFAPTPITPTPAPLTPAPLSATPEITIRLQIDPAGKFSAPYDMSIFNTKPKTQEFFAWFGSRTGRGGIQGPSVLTFTFQTMIPVPKIIRIPRLNDDDFRYMRQSIVPQFEETRAFMPGLKEFVVLITDPGWGKSG